MRAWKPDPRRTMIVHPRVAWNPGYTASAGTQVKRALLEPRGRSSMDKVHMLEDLQQRIAALFSSSPAADIQKNLKALLMQQFARLELVTQEEFELQRQVLARTREKLEALEERVAQLEARGS